MAAKNTSVFGIYPSRTAAEEAVGHLRGAGFRGTDTSALFPENQGTKDLAHEKSTKAPEGFTVGTIVGAIVGAVLGWLIGSGVWYVPSLAAVASAGSILCALAGLGALGILFGIIGGIIGFSFPEYEARRYSGRIRDGGVLLSVHCDSHEWVKRAKEVMAHTGAQDIAAEMEKSGDFANNDKPLPRVRNAADPNAPVNDVVYTDRPAPSRAPLSPDDPAASRVPPPPDPGVVTGDEVYTERIVQRRTVQDPNQRR